MKRRRKSTRIRCRKLDRLVAKHRMKKAGVRKPNKNFAENWRKWCA